ncbi:MULTISPECIES: hypothetical protein [unclassified Streptomyces]|uniref:hypothetical protein n=1 Tax=unclassified Streptomyces TaxID=2593676 RepID=UPI00093E6603|nr:hypothetical protein [Streptomyces sp. CB02400]OKJ99957.1 hypothetical protein AMK33_27925 [Streptomyces sp. CB02400]
MSENSTAATDLTSQYSAQVAGDLERNVKEQERVAAEIAALQEQLTVLQHDHTILVNMQQALGLVRSPAEPVGTPEAVGTSQPAGAPEAGGAPEADTVPDGATVPAPRRRGGAKSGTESEAEPGAKSGAEKPKRTRKAAATRTASGKSAASGKSTRKPPAAKADGPKLVELVRRHLGEQSEPRSAAEIAGALEQAHPERAVKTTVVRSTLEGLVARNQAQRTKQGSSVFYTTPDNTEQAPKADDDARS